MVSIFDVFNDMQKRHIPGRVSCFTICRCILHVLLKILQLKDDNRQEKPELIAADT